MKRLIHYTLIFLMLVFVANPLMAVNKPIKESTASAAMMKKDLTAKQIKKLDKFEKKLEKRKAKLESKGKNAGIDLEDPVEKWMWFWIFGWGAALAISFFDIFINFGLLTFLGAALWVFGLVALIL